MSRKGFTLVELIIALTLFSALLSGVLYAFGEGLRTWRKIAQVGERQQVKNLVAERICREVRAAKEVTTLGSEEVTLKMGSEIISYRLVNGKVRRKKGNSVAYLTNEGEIEKLWFSNLTKGMVEITVGDFSSCVSIRN